MAVQQSRTKRKARDWRFELLRLLSMLLIVAAHYYSSAPWPIRTDGVLSASWRGSFYSSLIMLGQAGVTCFVLISAYFLASNQRSPIKRLVRLWIQVFLYSAGLMAVFEIMERTGVLPGRFHVHLGVHGILSCLLPITFRGYWFVTAYFVVMAFAPFVAVLLEHIDRKRTFALIGVMAWITFFWQIINPQVTFFTDISYLLTIYLIGCAIRLYPEAFPRLKWWGACLTTLAGLVLCAAGTHLIGDRQALLGNLGYPTNLLTAGPGASPFIGVLVGIAIFLPVAQRCEEKPEFADNHWTRFVLQAATATFGVYLLHENWLIKPVLWGNVFALPMPSGAAKAVCSLGVILVLYVALLAVSWAIDHLIVRPLVRLIVK